MERLVKNPNIETGDLNFYKRNYKINFIRSVKMEGGMIETTVNQMRRIYMEEGRREVRQRRKQIIEEERQRINKKIEI